MVWLPYGIQLTALVVVAIFAATATVDAAPSRSGYSQLQQQQELQQGLPPPSPSGFLGGGAALGAPSFAAAGLGASEAFEADGGYSDGMGPPDPSKFRSPQDLKEYLERLQLYYALVGRPRFGKRSYNSLDYHSSASPTNRFRASADQTNDEQETAGPRLEVNNKGRGGSDKIYGFAVIF